LNVEENPFYSNPKVRKMDNSNIDEEFVRLLTDLEVFNGNDMDTVKKNIRIAATGQRLK